MRRFSLGLLVFLLLAGGKSLWGQSAVGNAVQFTAEGFYKHTGACSEFSFEWGNGFVFSGGEQKPLSFEPLLHDRYDGMLWCLNSRPFQLDGSLTSLSFDLAYRFFVEGCEQSEIVDYDSRDHQGSMYLVVELIDATTGERVDGVSKFFYDNIYVPLGSSYNGSEHREIRANSSPEWASTAGRNVYLQMSVHLFPGAGKDMESSHVAEVERVSIGDLK